MFAPIAGTVRFSLAALMALVLCAVHPAVSLSAAARDDAPKLLQMSNVAGGLCVQVGCDNTLPAVEIARTGRFLVHLLDTDVTAVERARQQLQSNGVYGLASADLLEAGGKLPYTENLVNLLMIRADYGVSLAEAVRVLCPNGVLLLRESKMSAADLQRAGLAEVQTLADDGPWLSGRKPWPKEMDEWPQSRHAADGNGVSHDTLVGPPRRIRWVAGPPQEISNMVTAAGRSFFAGVYARDSFNGLCLWQRELNPSPARGGFNFHTLPGSVRPVAAGSRLFVLSDNKVRGLDGATGKELREYPSAGVPTDLLYESGLLIAIDATSVRAVDAESGVLRWRYEAAQPQHVAAGDGGVFLIEGDRRQGQRLAAVRLRLTNGELQWRRDDLDWLPKVCRSVYHQGLLALEISTLNDDKPGNRIEVVSAADGKPLWRHEFIPGTAHKKQARALFMNGLVWLLGDRQCEGLDPQTGEVEKTYPAGWGHCFPPVATERFLFAGEMNLTDLASGRVDAHRITKGACSRDAGFVPANGLIYTFPKHCVCWPMLRDYAALAPAQPGDDATGPPSAAQFQVQRGPAEPPVEESTATDLQRQWPCYRHDAWRSGSTTEKVPSNLRILWTVDLGGWPDGPIADDWRHNSFIHGPVTAPVVAGGLVYVARADAHQVVALDAGTGAVRWTFTANGRIDTAPTIYRGLCLFGSKSGWVYCLRADDGRMIWRLRAAPRDERIVAYGQLESPWPVPGSVVVIDDMLFFAAGRQSLADGGILVFAAEPTTGKTRWVQRLDSVPQKAFYGADALEFDNFDLLHQEGSHVAMSRWFFDRRSGAMTCDAKGGFAHLTTGGCGVQFPRGSWSYAPRNESEQVKERPFLRPLVVFRDQSLYGCSEDRQTVYCRTFTAEDVVHFNTEWYSKRSTQAEARKGGDASQSQRLARSAKWTVVTSRWPTRPTKIGSMVLTRDALFLGGTQGGLAVLALDDGKLLSYFDLPSPLWDGMAAAEGCLFLTTCDGQVLCLGTR